jgi:hypothetical protein
MTKNYKKSFAMMFAALGILTANAQNVVAPAFNSPTYEHMKLNGTLPKNIHLVTNTNTAKSKSVIQVTPSVLDSTVNSGNGTCDCLVAIDASFTDVPFTNGVAPYYSNDDGYTNAIHLPFSFNYYGQPVDSIYINNNGNISFSSPYSTFTADSFPSANYNMIAAFWADVDTRDTSSTSTYDSLTGTWLTTGTTGPNGRVYYKMTATSLIIRWDNVGYFPRKGDKTNTFQLIISDGTDPLIPGGNNVAFCYGDMQWTTGSASSGINGFGGIPSTTGINKGNGVDYFQLTRNDHDGTDYDGPYGVADGVSFLDNSSYYFTTNTGGSNNIPPLALTNLCDTIFMADDDSITANFIFIGPENQQTVSAQLMPSPVATELSNTSGIMASVNVLITAGPGKTKFNEVKVVATDNGGATSTKRILVVSHTSTGINDIKSTSVSVSPNPTNGTLNIRLPKSGQLRILNSIGEVIISENYTGTSFVNVDMSTQANGIYFVQFTNGKEVSTTKFVKN